MLTGNDPNSFLNRTLRDSKVPNLKCTKWEIRAETYQQMFTKRSKKLYPKFTAWKKCRFSCYLKCTIREIFAELFSKSIQNYQNKQKDLIQNSVHDYFLPWKKMKVFLLSRYYYTFYHQDLPTITPSVTNGLSAVRKNIKRVYIG